MVSLGQGVDVAKEGFSIRYLTFTGGLAEILKEDGGAEKLRMECEYSDFKRRMFRKIS